MILTTLLLVLATVVILYKFCTRNYDYWEKRGVPQLKPLPVFGNFLEVFALRSHIGHFLEKCYNKFKTPYFGIYVLNRPYLVIRSLDLIKCILVKDFNYFCDRTVHVNHKLDSVTSKALFFSKNPEWKFMRSKITPAFSSVKVKNMVPLMDIAAVDMKVYLDKNCSQASLEAKEICAKFATDVLTSCAFGIEARCFQNEDSVFRMIGRKIFDFRYKNAVQQTCYFVAPVLVELFRMPFYDPIIPDFLRKIIWSTIEERERTKHRRNDVIDIIIQIKNNSSPNDDVVFEGDRVVAQAGQFYLAGLDTSSTTMSFALYELCIHPDIQDKARSEIKDIISQYKVFSYEALQDMKYLHMIICETLRKYPVLPFLDRMCVEDYKVPGTDFVIEKGTPVYIPMLGLHYDPEYFPDPQRFDPERFSTENKNDVTGYTYFPFGEGPRNCIGERFGMLSVKLGLARVLLEFEIEPSPDTPIPMKFETKGFLLGSLAGLPMKFRKIRSAAP